ncbi:MAG: phage portal protein, partial [Deltaproteobacteria bacterium]|nr:phage portal protein [Deltaproteobacteria bacterium]
MKIAETLSNAVDAAVGIISPAAAFRRQAMRNFLKKRQAAYAAAKSGRLTGSWAPADASVNDLIRASSPQVRARVRQLVRDFPIFVRAVTTLLDYTVGDGIKLQSRVVDAKGNLIPRDIKKIEDAFRFWADEADISKKLHYYELMELAKRQELETGEYIFVKRSSGDTKRYLPYALQAIEPDWLTDNTSEKVDSANEIDQGVEYDRVTGEVRAYHFTDPDGWGKAARVGAENVIHGFKVLRPGQIRGISPFAAAVLIAHDMSEYMDATIDGAKLAAKYLAFITKDPVSQSNLLTTDDDGNTIDEMENAIIEYLSPGESVTIAQNTIPGG